MRRFRVHHTSLVYDGPVRAAHNELRMTPLNEPGQTTLENGIRIRPMTWSHVYRDHGGTHVMAMESLSEHERLDIEAISTVERTEVDHHEPSLDWSAVHDPAVQDRSYEWLMLSPRTLPDSGIADLAEAVRGLPTPRAAADELCGLVRGQMRYERGITGVHSRGEDAWTERAGVCQDFVHITVGALRSLGLPPATSRATSCPSGTCRWGRRAPARATRGSSTGTTSGWPATRPTASLEVSVAITRLA